MQNVNSYDRPLFADKSPINPGGYGASFIRAFPPISFYPDNGSAFITCAVGESLAFTFSNGSAFDLLALDLAEYSTVVPEGRMPGYRLDGSIVTTELHADGIIDGTGPVVDFQTFTFDSRFRGLVRVEIPDDPWSLNNLVFGIPEPSALSLLIGGGLMLFWRRHRRHTH
jgi:hypothetical protein